MRLLRWVRCVMETHELVEDASDDGLDGLAVDLV